MEWKIGEIKQVNGEWYQCVEQPEKYDKMVCDLCAFQGNGNCELEMCSETYRSDKKSVIFKKLEKVGEPYTNGCKLFQRYKLFTPTNELVNLEIKQNKEDMEEKKVMIGELTYKYINGKITYEDFEKGVIELLNNKEESKPKLKEFDLEAAKFIIRCIVAHDYVMFEKVINGTIKDRIQIPIVEFYDIFQKLLKSEVLTHDHVSKYLPDYNRVEIYDKDSWCISKNYLKTNSNH